MKEVMEIVQNWGGIMLLLVLAVIGIIGSLAGSSSGEERKMNGKDEDHYVLRLPIGRVMFPLILLAVGIILEFLCNFLQERLFGDQIWLPLVVRLAIAVVFGILFWSQLAKVIRSRVFVNGDKIIVTPAFGASIETNFKQIRTVANKHAGRDRGVIGKKIRTKEGNRFEVINTMAGYDRFCEQLSEKVELPNLTKKLFKKHDKKVNAGREPEPEEVVSQEPLPQASPALLMPEAQPAFPAVSEEPVSTFEEAKTPVNPFDEPVNTLEEREEPVGSSEELEKPASAAEEPAQPEDPVKEPEQDESVHEEPEELF